MENLVASGELNKALQPIFSNIEHLHLIHDDLIIAALDQQLHYKALECVLGKVIETGLTFSPEKCLFSVIGIPFWGVQISAAGTRPDPAKVEFVHITHSPIYKEEVVSFLSMIQSNAEFIPNLSTLTANLRTLTEKHRKFIWTKIHQQEFDHIKRVFCKDTINRFFDPNQNTYLFIDAHHSSFGAILAQGSSIDQCRPVAIAS